MRKLNEKYIVLDAAILEKISAQPKYFSAILTGIVLDECRRIAAEEGKSVFDEFRILERRLQRLRITGEIRSTAKGWVTA